MFEPVATRRAAGPPGGRPVRFGHRVGMPGEHDVATVSYMKWQAVRCTVAVMATSDAAAQLHAQLEASLRELVTSEDWMAALEVASRFHDYSFANTQLIAHEARRRGFTPTRVAGYRKWQELGRQVRRGEQGIPILAPLIRTTRGSGEPERPGTPEADGTEGARRLVGFRVVHVFDVTQTDGEPLPEIRPRQLTGALPHQWRHLVDLIASEGFTLSFGDPTVPGANGVTSWDDRRVVVRGDLSGAQRFKTAAHELAHIRLHDPHSGTRPECRGVIEVEAESVAYIVSAASGIDTTVYSLPYVATWSNGDPLVVARTAQRVLDCARGILPSLEPQQNIQPAEPARTPSVEPGTVREPVDADGGTRSSQPVSDGGSMYTIHTPDHGAILTQDGGCATCGNDATHLVVHDGPGRPGSNSAAYNELACPQHAERARRGGAMTYPASLVGGALRRRSARDPDPRIEEVLQAAVGHYQTWLNGPPGEPARRHLTDRNLTGDTIERFQLGYAPPEWRTLTDALHHDGFTQYDMLAAGVAATARTGRLYDTMRGRLVFPIHDHHGHPAGMAGRRIDGEGPKYLNTAATTLYRKGELLYGYHHAQPGITTTGCAVIVEGYLDTVACHQAGITNTVALGGTTLTAHHLATLRRNTRTITLALDGDQAGAAATQRIHNLTGSADPDLNIRIATLPEGRDPADLITHHHTDILRQALTDAVPLPIHLIDQAIDRPGLDDTETAWQAIRDTTAILYGITDPQIRAAATQHIAHRLGWATDSIQRGLAYHHSETRTRAVGNGREASPQSLGLDR